MRPVLAAGTVLVLSLAGCASTTSDGHGPYGARDYVPMDASAPEAGDIRAQSPSTYRSVLQGYGAIDGPTGPDSPGRPDVRAVRGHDPSDFEPSIVLQAPDDGPFHLTDQPRIPDPFPLPPAQHDLQGPPPVECERPPVDPTAFDVFDAVIAEHRPNGGWYAAQLGVSDRCGLLYEQGYGVMGEREWADSYPGDQAGMGDADWWQHVLEPVGPDALFKIASTTKPVTSSVIHLMVRQGLIDYDDRAFCDGAGSDQNFWLGPEDDEKCLLSLDPAPNVDDGFDEVNLLYQAITVADLLEHQVGWDRDGDTGDFLFMPTTVANANNGLPPSREDFLRYALSQPLDYWPGISAPMGMDPYSNTGFLALGLIIEQWGSRSYIEYLRDSVMGSWGADPANIHLGSSLAKDFHPREVSYPCGGTRSAIFPGSPDPVCFMEGGIAMHAHHYGGSLLTNAGSLAEWMTHYWVDSFYDVNKGQPRYSDEANYTDYPDGEEGYHNGSLSGVKTLLQQCMNGYNFAFLSNSAFNSSTFPYNDLRNALCASVPAFENAGVRGVLHSFNTEHDWEVLHPLSGADHDAQAGILAAAGFRPEDVDCHFVGGEVRYSSVWSDRTGPSFAAQQGLSTAALQTEMEQRLADGFKPMRFTACNINGQIRWSVIWEYHPDKSWSAHPGLDRESFEAEVANKQAAGWRPVDLAVYVSGVPRYAAIWEPGPGAGALSTRAPPPPDWFVTLDKGWQAFYQEFLDRGQEDIKVTAVDIVRVGDEYRYSGIWTPTAPDTTMISTQVPYGKMFERHESIAVQYGRASYFAVA